MGKTRPCVIVSDDLRNEILRTVVICPMTSIHRPHWRTRLRVRSVGQASDVCADQIRVLSKSRLAGRIGRLSADDARSLLELLAEMYGAR
jgi:mRNA-degrading endonuclease toxin of MazEF toxin-antitoxin module